MVLLHIIIAVTSLLLSGILLARPHQGLLRVNSGLIAATLTSGVVLVAQGYDVLHVCAMGIVYTVVAVTLSVMTHRRIISRA